MPGLLGYHDGRAVAWVSLGPRGDYAKLERSAVMKRVDDQPARAADDSMWFGTATMFECAGFVEVARRKRMRPVMRRAVRGRAAGSG